MNLFFLSRRFRRLNVPGALLMMLLQRTPMLRVAAQAASAALAPIGAILRPLAVTAAAIGTLDTLAGATPLVPSSGTAAGVSVAVGTAVGVAYTVNGTQTPPASWQVDGGVPPGLNFSGLTAPGFVNVQTLRLTGTPTTAGTYQVIITAYEGPNGSLVPSPDYVYTITVTGGTGGGGGGGGGGTAPAISAMPATQSVGVGDTVRFTVNASGSPAPTFQWRKNGSNLANGGSVSGATTGTLTISGASAADAGAYTVVATNSAGAVTSDPATLTVNAAPISTAAAWLTNVSVRTTMLTGQSPLIVGVTVVGGAKNILVRGDGPALAAFGLSNVMVNPRLDLFPSGATTSTFSNDDWDASLASTFASVGAFAFTAGSKDAAFVQSLNGGYTIQAPATGPGALLVEAYDTSPNTGSPRLTNISANNRVGTGADILIAGFAINGSGTKRLLIRAVGPTLGGFGVSGVLTDPKLEVYNSANVKIAENNDWDPSLASTFQSVGAFALTAGSKDAAIIVTLNAGASYTVQAKGADGGTGQALIEVYELP